MSKYYRGKRSKRAADVLDPRQHYSVYVVQLQGVPRGSRNDVYVGMTGLSLEKRYQNHQWGHGANARVRRYGVKLVPGLYKHLNPMTYEEACRAKKNLAEELRKRGYGVYGGH